MCMFVTVWRLIYFDKKLMVAGKEPPESTSIGLFLQSNKQVETNTVSDIYRQCAI